MERIGTRKEGFDVTALQAALGAEEVYGLVHDHLMLLSLGVLPGRTSSVERPNKDCMDGYC